MTCLRECHFANKQLDTPENMSVCICYCVNGDSDNNQMILSESVCLKLDYT